MGSVDGQRFSILGRVWSDDDPQWQQVLARVHDTAERPRCLCVPGGVEMYVAQHRQLVVKRMPDTGSRHHPGCPSYELPAQDSGLGELLGEAVLESATGSVNLRVDFPWMRTGRTGVVRGDAELPAEVVVEKRRMSLRALMHYLFERAGFNRWTPAMEGKRNQGVLHKYLMDAAADVSVKGEALVDRLYVPEPFNEATRSEAAARRRQKFAMLRPTEGSNSLALVMGEFKACEPAADGRRVWVRHMPDAPLLVGEKTWRRVERIFAPLLQARDADTGCRMRLMLAALVRARREYTYEIDAASLMLASSDWIPLDGVHEAPLVQALIAQRRRFVKPLRYDAKSAAAFPNAQLLDVGATPAALHVVSPFMTPSDRAAKDRSIARAGAAAWVWRNDQSMPPFPAATAST
jgi:hypothetical protein